jgi:hypothetical protein
MTRGELGGERQQFVLLRNLVDLVDDHDRFASGITDALEHGFVFFTEAQRLHHEHHEIRVRERGRGGAVHRAVERAPLAEVQSGSIHECELDPRAVEHAEHAMPRGLRPRGHDRELLAHQGIEQGRLPHVGPADDGGKAGAK